MKGIRLNKYISDSGYCSRRQADEYIIQGRVTINNEDAPVGSQVLEGDEVAVDGERIGGVKRRIYMAFNKPVGVTCTTDLRDDTNIVSFIGHQQRIFNIGRLDKMSEGLIFMTNDGDIVNKILRAGNNHEKEYVVTVDKPINDGFVSRMSSGVHLGSITTTKPCKIMRETDTRFRIILTQGLNRQIRRMCEALGYNVVTLKRVRIMNIKLGMLELGSWRYFTPQEIEQISTMISDSSGTQEASYKKREKPDTKSVKDGEVEETAPTSRRIRAAAKGGSTYRNYRGEPKSKPERSSKEGKPSESKSTNVGSDRDRPKKSYSDNFKKRSSDTGKKSFSKKR